MASRGKVLEIPLFGNAALRIGFMIFLQSVSVSWIALIGYSRVFMMVVVRESQTSFLSFVGTEAMLLAQVLPLSRR